MESLTLINALSEHSQSPNDVRAVVYQNSCIGGVHEEVVFDTGLMDNATMSRKYPISATTGIDTLHKPVFYRRDGKEIPDPRVYLEDIE